MWPVANEAPTVSRDLEPLLFHAIIVYFGCHGRQDVVPSAKEEAATMTSAMSDGIVGWGGEEGRAWMAQVKSESDVWKRDCSV